MKTKRVRKFTEISVFLSAVFAVLVAASPPLHAKNSSQVKSLIVDCSEPGASVQAQINKADGIVTTRIVVSGMCTEDIVIQTDKVTINGDPTNGLAQGGTSQIDGSVSISGASDVRLEDVTVQNGGFGVDVTNNSSISLKGVVVDGSSDTGLLLSRNSFALAEDLDVTNHTGVGVFLFDLSYMRLLGTNEFSNNGAENLNIEGTSRVFQDSGPLTIANSGANPGIFLLTHAALDIREGTISDNVGADGLSSFRIQGKGSGTTFSGNLTATANSIFSIRGTTTFIGAVSCPDGTVISYTGSAHHCP